MEKNIISFILIFLSTIMFACKHDVEKKPDDNRSLNSFKMELNGSSWTPSVIDSCNKTFMCNMSSINGSPYYEIKAYKDSRSIASNNSSNIFDIQIMDVNNTGIYYLNGALGALNSYAMFIINENSGKKFYLNKENGNSFSVEITDFLPRENSQIVGIKGFFNGILYNKENALDSIVIRKGEFNFQKTNWYNFNQCRP